MTRSAGPPARVQPAASGRLAACISAVAVFAAGLAVWLAVWTLAPMALGWQPHVVSSGSMAPSVRVGDVLVTAPADSGPIGRGEIVTFRGPLHGDRLVTHRVVRQNPDGTLVTRGDANADPDPAPVDPGQVAGVGRVVVPLVGLPYVWVTTGAYPQLAAFGTVVVALALAAVGLRPNTAADTRSRRSRRRVAVLAGFGTVAVAGGAGMALSLRNPQALLATGILEMATVAALAVPRLRERTSRTSGHVRTAPRLTRRVGKVTAVSTAGLALLVVAASLIGGVAPTAGAFTASTDNGVNSYDAATLAPPTNLAGECLLGVIDLSWTAATHASSYRVFRSTTSGGPYSEIGTTTGTTFTDSSISLDSYYYVVQSANGPWSSGNSAEVAVTTTLVCL